MSLRELKVPGAFEYTPKQFGDDRGVFFEWFKASVFEPAVGHPLRLEQANCSVSAAGVLRGIHYTVNPPGQAKYVTCTRGAFLDVVVDLRQDSPTYGTWDSVLIDDVDRRAVYLPEGLGHAILSLEDKSTVMYLCSIEYTPSLDRDINPLDPDLAIDWPTHARDGSDLEYQLSDKDKAAPGFASLPRDAPMSVKR
ncbi:dTDP-4-dehydrorhamnose 3,5-epimerase family protein [Actinomycetes bacterium M1A6_2h]